MSGDKYPAICMIFPAVAAAIKDIKNAPENGDQEFAAVKEKFVTKLKTRFEPSLWKPLYIVAMVLDPRFKMSLIQGDLEKGPLRSQVQEIIETQLYPCEIVEEEPRLIESHSSTAQSSIFDTLANQLSTASDAPSQVTELSELECYLSAPLVPFTENYNGLEFWKLNTTVYSKLSQVARRYLGIPASNTNSERLGSLPANVITKKRASLLGDNAGKLIKLKRNSSLLQ